MSNKVYTKLTVWEYQDTALPSPQAKEAAAPKPVPGLTEEQAAARTRSALLEAEQRWSTHAAEQELRRKQEITAALDGFAEERATYFRRVETEVVQLALAVARKILQREANLDPTLLAALVRIALDRMKAGSAVKLRLPPEEVSLWRDCPTFAGGRYQCEFVGDDTLAKGDCLLETDLGAGDFGLETQLKEVEQGLLDLLAQRPDGR